MFETGTKNFWKFQIAGWSVMAISNLLVQITAGFPFWKLAANSTLPFVSGVLVTTAYRYIIRQYPWKRMSVPMMVLLIFVSTLIQACLFLFLTHIAMQLIGQTAFSALPVLLSNLFIFGVIMLCWNLIYFAIHYFNNWHQSELEKWQLQSEMQAAELGALRAQINPHFVFNALNNIRALILEDPDRAREMLLNFSDLFRYSLKHNEHSTVALSEELEMIRQYLELLSIQFEDKLRYNILVEGVDLSHKIPPMMLQLLVENAIKHGISQSAEGGIIQVSAQQLPSSVLQLEISNSGTLKTQSPSVENRLGVGLENIKKRLQLLYNGKAQFQLKEQQNFVLATIKIPLV